MILRPGISFPFKHLCYEPDLCRCAPDREGSLRTRRKQSQVRALSFVPQRFVSVRQPDAAAVNISRRDPPSPQLCLGRIPDTIDRRVSAIAAACAGWVSTDKRAREAPAAAKPVRRPPPLPTDARPEVAGKPAPTRPYPVARRRCYAPAQARATQEPAPEASARAPKNSPATSLLRSMGTNKMAA